MELGFDCVSVTRCHQSSTSFVACKESKIFGWLGFSFFAIRICTLKLTIYINTFQLYWQWSWLWKVVLSLNHNSAYSPFVPKFREVFLAATSIGFQIQEQKTLWKQICAYQKVMEASKDRMAIALHIVDEYLLGYRIPCDMSQSFPSQLYIRCTHKDW